VNIFVLDEKPTVAASYHCDKHVVKMILETAQMLSTIHRNHGYVGDELYKATHAKHPCTVWAGETAENYSWTYQLFVALCDEYTLRYNKIHATSRLLEPLSWMPEELPDDRLTPFAQAMPEDVRGPEAVAAYRAYYRTYKRDIATWRYTPVPEWWGQAA
jgi:hypothetical protein